MIYVIPFLPDWNSCLLAYCPGSGPSRRRTGQPSHSISGDLAGDELGSSVSAAGDVNNDGYEDFIVGAPLSDLVGTDTGVAKVYSGANGALLHMKFGVSSSFGYNHTGRSVSGAGDVNGDGFDDFIIGSPQGSPLGTFRAGEALLYSGVDGQLLRVFRGPAFDDQLGYSVSSVGDIDGDGLADVVIGAPFADPIGVNLAGAAFVYSALSGNLIYTFIGHSPSERLGLAVSAAGDVNGDGTPDILIGALGASPQGRSSAGSAFVYSGADQSLLHQFDGAAAGDNHGLSVAKAGDVDGDGFDDLLVGGSGSATLYSGLTGAVLQQFSSGTAGDGFGSSVSGSADVDGDGVPDVAIGAASADPNGITNAGAAYLYSGATGLLLDRVDGTSSNSALGRSVAIMPDSNGNGKAEWIYGASGDSPGGIAGTGSSQVLGFDSFVTPSSYSVSAAAGGTIDWQLDFPSNAAGNEYRMVMSASGMGPTFYGVNIPLSLDPLVMQTFAGSYPFPSSTNLQGTLDANGDASCSFDTPAGLPISYIGRTFWIAVIASPSGLLPSHSSIVVPVTVMP